MNLKSRIQEIILSFSTIGTTVSGEHLTVHVYANSGSEKLLVGRLDLLGKSQSTFKASLTVVHPEGYQLTANLVDSYGLPFDAGREVGIKINQANTAKAQREVDDLDNLIRKSEAFEVLNGEVFINNAFIDDCLYTGSYDASMGLNVDSRRLIDRCIEESIRMHCRPGGIIWRALSR